MIGSRVATPNYWAQRLDESSKAREYEALKGRWIREHPNATPSEYEEFIVWLCKWIGREAQQEAA